MELCCAMAAACGPKRQWHCKWSSHPQMSARLHSFWVSEPFTGSPIQSFPASLSSQDDLPVADIPKKPECHGQSRQKPTGKRGQGTTHADQRLAGCRFVGLFLSLDSSWVFIQQGLPQNRSRRVLHSLDSGLQQQGGAFGEWLLLAWVSCNCSMARMCMRRQSRCAFCCARFSSRLRDEIRFFSSLANPSCIADSLVGQCRRAAQRAPTRPCRVMSSGPWRTSSPSSPRRRTTSPTSRSS